MPEVFREGPYRFFFYSNENDEPLHVHVRAENRFAKFWLDPIKLEYSHKMRPLNSVKPVPSLKKDGSRL